MGKSVFSDTAIRRHAQDDAVGSGVDKQCEEGGIGEEEEEDDDD